MPGDAMEDLVDWVRSRYFGKYRGTVSDNDDQTQARPRQGARAGRARRSRAVGDAVRAVRRGRRSASSQCRRSGTGVWVEFEAGDPSFPIWTGCFWADSQLPSTAAPAVKLWKTDSVTITIDDDNADLVAENTSGSKITIGDDVIADSGGSTHTVGSDGVVAESGGAKHSTASEGVKSESSGSTHSVASAGVTSESSGAGKIEVTSASVKVNSGAMEVV